MLTGACGMVCGACKLLSEEACEMCGCVPGTDERVPDKQRRMKAELGSICSILECAAQKRVDYCFKCREFPCRNFYAHEMPEKYATPGEEYKPFPFNREFLNRFKSLKETLTNQATCELARKEMRVAACGITCEFCPFLVNGKCEMDGCCAGNHKEAPGKLEKLRSAGTRTCDVLACAISKKVDYCLRCPEFPCDIHYRRSPYCTVLLEYFKEYSAEHKGRFKQVE